MDAVDRYLLPAERRVVAVRRHPALLLRPVALLVGVVVVGLLIGSLLPAGRPWSTLVALALLAVLVRTLWRVGEWWVNRFIVTDQRIMLISGLMTRRVAMLPLRKVMDLTYARSPMGRMLGYGEFLLESAGPEQVLRRIGYIPQPDELYIELADLLFGDERKAATEPY